MNRIYNKLIVYYDKDRDGESTIGVFGFEREKNDYRLLTMRQGEKAALLYELLTDQATSIKTERSKRKPIKLMEINDLKILKVEEMETEAEE